MKLSHIKFSFLLLLLASITISCKRDYNCNCQIKALNSNGTDDTYNFLIIGESKSDAQDECDAQEKFLENNDEKVSCDLDPA